MERRQVFVTGGTGYMGRELLRELLLRGHNVRALVRRGSEGKVPPGCDVIVGDALDEGSFERSVAPADSFAHLVGVHHPTPTKAAQFVSVDLASLRASLAAAMKNQVRHFVYVSVAQPSSVMKAYVAARAEGERLIREGGLNATILRPWYVLGPGHRWPYLLVPVFWILEHIPATRERAARFGFVNLTQMTAALVSAIEKPADGIRIWEVPEIRKGDAGEPIS